MDLELLKKLVRLATNNPNEHEAHSAAMRVCKMLIDCDFKLTTNFPKTDSRWTPSWYASDPIYEWMKKQHEKQQKEDREKYKAPWVYEPYNRPTEKPKRVLTCTQCHKAKETIFVGHPAGFVCNECHWTNFAKF